MSSAFDLASGVGGARHKLEGELRRIAHFKRHEAPAAAHLGPELISFFKGSVQKRQTKLASIASCWERLVPRMLDAHCALDSLSRGSLVVLVDSSSHLFELKQLLLAGLERQLLVACKSAGLRKITLRSGRWYDTEKPQRPAFVL